MSFNELDLIVLKSIVSSKKNGLEFSTENDTKIFSPEVWNFANLAVGYIRTYKELPTARVMVEKIAKGNDKLVENIKTVWSHLDKTIVDEKEFKHDLEKLNKRFAEKQILTIKDSLSKLDSGNIDIKKIVSDLQKTVKSIDSLEHKKTFESKTIKDYLPTFVEKFNAKKNNPEADKGLMTGYSFLDYATNGLKDSDFLLIAGESGFGKSLFLNNIAVQVWLQKNKIDFKNKDNPISNLTPGKDIAYFSLEMPYEDCFNRFLSRLSGVPSRKIENADLSKDEFAKIKVCLDFIKEYPHNFRIIDIVDASSNELEDILLDSGEKYAGIFIDYLGIMKTNDKSEEADWLKQGVISYEIRRIARRNKIPVFSAVQLNRKAQSKESSENIGLNRLARSATIATHATHVIQIENRQNEDKYPDFLYHLIKNRKGPKGQGSLIKNLACATLIEKEEKDLPKNGDDKAYEEYFKDQNDISKDMEDLEL